MESESGYRMKRYTTERREWAVAQMMPPRNRTPVELAKASGITAITLRTWRDAAKAEGKIIVEIPKTNDHWSSEEKFRIVLEAAPLSETELSEYCRIKGIHPEQVWQWRQACEGANANKPAHPNDPATDKRIWELERELNRKNAALAETAALLVLRKKAEAIWGTGEET